MKKFSHQIRLLFVAVCLFAGASWADTLWVGTVDEIDTKNQRLLIGDKYFSYTPFLVVQEYGAKDSQRLAFKSIEIGDWVAVVPVYFESVNARGAEKIFLLDNQRHAEQIQNQQL